MVATYNGNRYNELIAGEKGRWQFVHRVKQDEAVCLVSRISGDKINCKQIIRTKNSNSMGIKDHAMKIHGFDIDKELAEQSNSKHTSMARFMQKKKLNHILSYESAIAQCIGVNFMSINQVMTNYPLQKLIKKEFNQDLKSKSFNEVRKTFSDHASLIKRIYSDEIKSNLQTKKAVVSFDEWSSSSSKQMVNIIVHFGSLHFNLGLVEVDTEAADAKSLSKLIFDHLQTFGVAKDDVKVLVADGAAVNGKISKLMDIPIAKCFNHGIQLAIVDTFYNKSAHFRDDDTVDAAQTDDSPVAKRPMIEEEHSDQNVSSIEIVNESSVDGADETSDDDSGENSQGLASRSLADCVPVLVSLVDSEEKSVFEAINNVRSIMKAFRKPKSLRMLKKYTPLRPKLDFKTRWKSLSAMISRFVEIKVPIQKALH